MNARLLAIRVITPLLNNSGSLKYSLQKQLADCPENQRPFLQELCYGSMRFYPKLIGIVNSLIKKPIRTKDTDIKAILLIGIYQLYKMNTAEHAIISETVDICKLVNKQWAVAFVNAALRNFQRNKDSIISSLDSDLSFKYNHPAWFVHKLKSNWPDDWQQILSANDKHPPLTLRLNCNKVSRETYIDQLETIGVMATKTEYSEYGITLDKPLDVKTLPGFEEGQVSVQDEAAQLAAILISPEPGDNILDA